MVNGLFVASRSKSRLRDGMQMARHGLSLTTRSATPGPEMAGLTFAPKTWNYGSSDFRSSVMKRKPTGMSPDRSRTDPRLIGTISKRSTRDVSQHGSSASKKAERELSDNSYLILGNRARFLTCF